MWNFMNLNCPSNDFCEYYRKSPIIKDVPELVTLLTSSAEILNEDNPIWTEIKVFQSIQSKYKRILHCDKSLQLLQRVGTCLRKMVLLNLAQYYMDLAERLLNGIKGQGFTLLLPSRQQLQYVLIRTQSAAKLICEALHYSRETFCYLIQRLRVGHLVLNLMMATSVTARVNILFKGILLQIIDVYRKLKSWTSRLKEGTSRWQNPLNLPEDLEVWLNLEETEVLEPKHIASQDLSFLNNFFKTQEQEGINDSVVESEDCTILEDSTQTSIIDENDTGDNSDSAVEIESENDCTIFEDSTQTSIIDENDLGEVIQRPCENENSDSEKKISLLSVIQQSTNFNQLFKVWKEIDDWSGGIFPHTIKSGRIRRINQMFEEFEKKLMAVNEQHPSIITRRKKTKRVNNLYRNKFIQLLGLNPQKFSSSVSNPSCESLKPVSKFKELRKLYNDLYALLDSSGQQVQCKKLKKLFKSTKENIRVMVENNEKEVAKQLIQCTSKAFLTRFKP